MNGIANIAKLHSNPIFEGPCGIPVLGICLKSRPVQPIDTKKKVPEDAGGSGFESAAWTLGSLAPRMELSITHDLAFRPSLVMMKCHCLRLQDNMQ